MAAQTATSCCPDGVSRDTDLPLTPVSSNLRLPVGQRQIHITERASKWTT
jgi:hypothetical protein